MNLTDVFDQTYVLNLPERVDRRQEMGQVLKNAGMDWEPGKVDLYAATRAETAGSFPSRAVRGCFLSHLGMIKAARARGASRLLVMEDDLMISSLIPGSSDGIARRLGQDDWSFAYLGHNTPVEWSPGSPATMIPLDRVEATNHFYAIHGQAFDRLIEFLELVLSRPDGHPDGGAMHVDGAFHFFRSRNLDLRTLVACPNLGWQRSSPSDISPRWFDNMPVLSQCARVGRLIKRRLSSRMV